MRVIFTFVFLTSFFGYSQNLSDMLTEHGFENVQYFESNRDIFLSYENNLFRFEAKALADVLKLISDQDLTNFNKVTILLKRSNIPLVLLKFPASLLTSLKNGSINSSDFINSVSMSFDIDRIDSNVFDENTLSNSSFFKFDLPIGIEVDYLLGDFNNGFQSRTKIKYGVLTTLGKGLSLEFGFNGIVQNDIPGRAISSPSVFKVNKSFRFDSHNFLGLNFGYLPGERFGSEVFYRNYPTNESFYVEFFLGLTRKGYLDQNWLVQTNRDSNLSWRSTFNYRWNKYDTDLSFSYGTFVSGDLGYKLDINRQFNEIFINLFYARTDLVSTGSFNSTEKGILGFGIVLPFGQSKYIKPNKFRIRTDEKFELLYRYSGFSFSGIEFNKTRDLMTDIREFYPEILRSGFIKYW